MVEAPVNHGLDERLAGISGPNTEIEKQARARFRQQARPAGSLGLLEEAGVRLAGLFSTLDVRLDHKTIVTVAGDHGVVEEGVTLFPQEVTAQMVHNFVMGGASINVLARHAGANVRVADLGVKTPLESTLPIFHKRVADGTGNIAQGPAMTREQAIQALQNGIAIVDELVADFPLDLLGTGDMGIGNTTPSAAIMAALSGMPVQELTGRGTGIDDEMLQHKVAVIEKALDVNKPDPTDPIDTMAKVGGFEIAGLAGLVLGAAIHGVPVVCDGLISTAGALIACEIAPMAKTYLFASHRSVEQGHWFMHQRLGLDPLLDIGFRLGEGTGAALSMNLLEAATRVLFEIWTFDEVSIADANPV